MSPPHISQTGAERGKEGQRDEWECEDSGREKLLRGGAPPPPGGGGGARVWQGPAFLAAPRKLGDS